MATQDLINIVSNEDKFGKLKQVIQKGIALKHDEEVLKQEKKELSNEVKKLGLKPAEFHKLIKYRMNEELLMNELSFLECVNDNVIGNG